MDPQEKAVPGAQVALFSTTGDLLLTTESDASGKYAFATVRSGDYLIEASAPGFSSYREQNLHLETGKKLSLDLHLSLGAVAEQVSVTASSTPQPVEELSKALSIVDNASLQERDAYSLTDGVRLTPGLRVDQLGGPGAFSEIRIRGLRPEDTSVLVDGMRLRDASATQADASSFLEDFLLTDDNRIEILRGSGSSLYGTNAIGGVVNVITDPGGGPTHGSVQLEGGGLGLFRGSAVIAGGMKNDRVQYSAGIMHLNVTNGVGGDAPARVSSFQGHLSIRLSQNVQLIARFFGVDNFSELSTDPLTIADYPTGIVPAIPLTGAGLAQYISGVPPSNVNLGNATYIPSIDDPDYRLAGRYQTGALMLLGQPTSRLGYSVQYQIVNSTRKYANGPGGPGYQPNGNTYSDYYGRIQTVNAQANYQAGEHNLITGGYEFESEDYSSSSTAALDPSSNSSTTASQRSNTAFIQDQARFFGDHLYVSGAFRSQFFSLQQPTFLPAANAPYQALNISTPPPAYTGDASLAYMIKRSATKIRAHAGRGYRAPSLYERFGAGYDAFFGYSVYGDPLLKPEQSIAVDAGIDQSLLNNKLRLSSTYFYTHLQRVITFDFSGLINPVADPYGRSVGYLNTNGGFARGVEFNANWTVSKQLTVVGSYTYTDARERIPLVTNVYRSFITPLNQFTLFAVQRIDRRLLVDFELTAATSYLGQVYSTFSSGAFQFPGQKRADIGVTYRLPIAEKRAIRFFGRAENVFGQNYYESGFRTPGVVGRGGLQYEF
ncbi:MAG: TonB-dependent receptor [Acidobacteriaceae bacterium]|nr:TonB-dependent receptor [Acidobacteriaceae bacterium]